MPDIRADQSIFFSTVTLPVVGRQGISENLTAAVLCPIDRRLQGVKQILVKLGSKGSALFVEGKDPIRQPIIEASKVLDTTGAGDTFTAAFGVALVEGKTMEECLRFAGAKHFFSPTNFPQKITTSLTFDCLFVDRFFSSIAAAAASLCVQVKGAIPSMPERSAVMKLLQSA